MQHDDQALALGDQAVGLVLLAHATLLEAPASGLADDAVTLPISKHLGARTHVRGVQGLGACHGP